MTADVAIRGWQEAYTVVNRWGKTQSPPVVIARVFLYVLDLAQRREQMHSQPRLARELGIPRTTIAWIFVYLYQHGFMRRVERRGRTLGVVVLYAPGGCEIARTASFPLSRNQLRDAKRELVGDTRVVHLTDKERDRARREALAAPFKRRS